MVVEAAAGDWPFAYVTHFEVDDGTGDGDRGAEVFGVPREATERLGGDSGVAKERGKGAEKIGEEDRRGRKERKGGERERKKGEGER